MVARAARASARRQALVRNREAGRDSAQGAASGQHDRCRQSRSSLFRRLARCSNTKTRLPAGLRCSGAALPVQCRPAYLGQRAGCAGADGWTFLLFFLSDFFVGVAGASAFRSARVLWLAPWLYVSNLSPALAPSVYASNFWPDLAPWEYGSNCFLPAL